MNCLKKGRGACKAKLNPWYNHLMSIERKTGFTDPSAERPTDIPLIVDHVFPGLSFEQWQQLRTSQSLHKVKFLLMYFLHYWRVMSAGRNETDYVHRIDLPVSDPYKIGEILSDFSPVTMHPNLISGWIHGKWNTESERLGGIAERHITNILVGPLRTYKSGVTVMAIGVLSDERPVAVITVMKGKPPARGKQYESPVLGPSTQLSY